MRAIQAVFEKGPSRFARWTLSPFLVLFMLFFASTCTYPNPSNDGMDLTRTALLETVLLASLLSLWGVPHVIRIVTGVVAYTTGYILFKQAFSTPDPLTSSSNDLAEALMFFLVFGLPCALYTILGRFSLKKNVEPS